MAGDKDKPTDKRIGSGYELRGGIQGSGKIARNGLEIPKSAPPPKPPEPKKK